MDQTLSKENLIAVWERANRQGRNLARDLVRPGDPPDILLRKVTTNYSRSSNARALLRQLLKASAPQLRIDAARRLVDTLRDGRQTLVESFLNATHGQIDLPAFRIGFEPSYRSNGTTIYRLRAPYPTNYLACKLLESNIREAFKPQMPSRDEIVEQLASVLADRFPKTVIRGDARQFYESIPHAKLLGRLRENTDLGTTTFRLVNKFLQDYEAMTGLNAGLPRGISLSAALAEAYMSSFDLEQRTSSDTYYYARFVDDVVAVRRYRKGHNYLGDMAADLQREDLALTDKVDKLYEESFTHSRDQLKRFEFLGYGFTVDSGSLSIDMSHARVRRLRKRMQSSFDTYNNSRKQAGRAAHHLYNRIRFLTSNTRLANNKRSAFVGIRFSNRHVTSTAQYLLLDAELTAHLSGIGDPRLKDRLSRLSFERGFEESVFIARTVSEIEEITSVWSSRG